MLLKNTGGFGLLRAFLWLRLEMDASAIRAEYSNSKLKSVGLVHLAGHFFFVF